MNKFVLIPHDEYTRLKDYLLNNKEKIKNNEKIYKHDIDPVKNDDINLSLEKDLLDIKANSATGQSQRTEELLPPPGFPAQIKDTEVKTLEQTGDGKKDDWIRKWKKTIR